MDACSGLTYEGCCDGPQLTWCEGGELQRLDCESSGCGWNPGAGFYDGNRSEAGPASFPQQCPAL